MSTEQAREGAMPEAMKQPELEVVTWRYVGRTKQPLADHAAALSIIESLRAELQEAKRDAGRYRWLRQALDSEQITSRLHDAFQQGSDALDAAIDAALAASSQGGGNG